MNQQSWLHSNLSRLSRRGFMRAAMVASAGALVQITTEADLAYAQRRPGKAAPSNAVLLDANENPLGPSTESCAAIAGLGAQGGRYHFGLSQELARTFAESEGLKPDSPAVRLEVVIDFEIRIETPDGA